MWWWRRWWPGRDERHATRDWRNLAGSPVGRCCMRRAVLASKVGCSLRLWWRRGCRRITQHRHWRWTASNCHGRLCSWSASMRLRVMHGHLVIGFRSWARRQRHIGRDWRRWGNSSGLRWRTRGRTWDWWSCLRNRTFFWNGRRSASLFRHRGPWWRLGHHILHVGHLVWLPLPRDRGCFRFALPLDRATRIFAGRALNTLHAWDGHHGHSLLLASNGAGRTLHVS